MSMDVRSMSTEELDRLLHEQLSAEVEDLQEDLIRNILKELRIREPDPTPSQLQAMWPTYMRLTYPDPDFGSCYWNRVPGQRNLVRV